VLTLVWRARALDDLRQIITYIAERDVAAAERLQDAIEAIAERLPEHPFMFRPGRVPGTREAVVHPNYILVYRVTADVVEVVNLVHARQAYP
jgi:addiction module RelE/StbE family toxin